MEFIWTVYTYSLIYVYIFPEFRLALIQLAVGANKTENLARAAKLVADAANAGAKVVSLPVRIWRTCYVGCGFTLNNFSNNLSSLWY